MTKDEYNAVWLATYDNNANLTRVSGAQPATLCSQCKYWECERYRNLSDALVQGLCSRTDRFTTGLDFCSRGAPKN